MIKCPMCEKSLPEHDKVCGKCGTDVSLLVHYVNDLEDGLRQAEVLTSRGELGSAVWKYLEVLEVDPDNAVARKQVGRVATAVRQFDQQAPGRRWFKKLQKQNRWRRWMSQTGNEGDLTGWLTTMLWLTIAVIALFVGYMLGTHPRASDGADKKGAPTQTQDAGK